MRYFGFGKNIGAGLLFSFSYGQDDSAQSLYGINFNLVDLDESQLPEMEVQFHSTIDGAAGRRSDE